MADSRSVVLTRLSSFEEFCALKAEWDALAATQVSTVFLTHDWLYNWWNFYGAGNELWILAASDAHKLLGIVPLMLRRGSDGFRRLVFMGSGEVTPNHLDVIVEPARRQDVLQALSEYLRQTVSQWDILELDKLPADSGISEQLGWHLRSQGLAANVETSARCAYEDLPDSFEEYLGDLNTRHPARHHNLKRKRRRLERRFSSVVFGRCQTQEQLDRAMTALAELHQARWTKRGYPGAFSNERFTAFHRAAASQALRAASLRVYYLQVGSDIAAVSYCYRVGDFIQSYLGGFDNRFAEYSPGSLLKALVIEQSIAEGARRLDLLEGEEEYKAVWATSCRDNLRLRVVSPSWRGQLARVRTETGEFLSKLGVRYVPKNIRRPIWQALLRFRAARQGNKGIPGNTQ